MSAEDYYVHDWNEFFIQFPESFPLDGIRWYGLSYCAGFVCAICLLAWYHRKGRSPLGPDARSTLMLAVIVGVLCGGRLGYVFLYDISEFLANPLTLFMVWKGGMASHGGFIGVALALLWFARYSKMSLLRLGDIAVTIAPPGLFFGRLANFINDELWGKVSDVSHAVIFPQAQEARFFDPAQFTVYSEQLGRLVNPRHPSQLYEAMLEGLVLFALAQWRFWKFPKLPKGQLSGEFLLAYAVLRITGEVYRESDADLVFESMSRGSFYSLFMILIGVALIIYARKLAAKNTAKH